MAPCPGCLRLIPVHEIHELADLGEHFLSSFHDENTLIGDHVAARGALDPAWHDHHCGLLAAHAHD